MFRFDLRLVLLAFTLAACGAQQPDVSIGLYQTRSDMPLDKMEMQVRNNGDQPITVERAQLVSTRLTQFPIWEEAVEIAPGAAVDLKVQLPPAVCSEGGSDEVRLTIDGEEYTLPADDTLQQMAKYVEAQCFRQDVEQTASITATGLKGDVLHVVVDGPVTIAEVGTTTLFKPRDPHALATGDPLRLLPNRCDAHALADDKQGTYFPLTVALPDGRLGSYRLGVDPQLRNALYRFYARKCGL